MSPVCANTCAHVQVLPSHQLCCNVFVDMMPRRETRADTLNTSLTLQNQFTPGATSLMDINDGLGPKAPDPDLTSIDCGARAERARQRPAKSLIEPRGSHAAGGYHRICNPPPSSPGRGGRSDSSWGVSQNSPPPPPFPIAPCSPHPLGPLRDLLSRPDPPPQLPIPNSPHSGGPHKLPIDDENSNSRPLDRPQQ